MTEQLVNYFMEFLAYSVIILIVWANFSYHEDLAKMTPEERAEEEKKDLFDMNVW